MEKQYEPMLDMPHHVSHVHPPMPMYKRAAQFSPFAALTGYENAIEEIQRQTVRRHVLTEDEENALNDAVQKLLAQTYEYPMITIVYFKADKKKSGGAYETVTGQFRTLDTVNRKLWLVDGTELDLDEIMEIIFD